MELKDTSQNIWRILYAAFLTIKQTYCQRRIRNINGWPTLRLPLLNMSDIVSKEKRSENMRRIRSKGMKPEMIVRRLVHGMGYRYRLHDTDLPGKPDLVFGPKQKVIFVHGCFWHQHDSSECPITRKPKSNQEYWIPKLQKNVARDQGCQKQLYGLGWDVMTVWECETKDFSRLRQRIKSFLSDYE